MRQTGHLNLSTGEMHLSPVDSRPVCSLEDLREAAAYSTSEKAAASLRLRPSEFIALCRKYSIETPEARQ